MPEEIPYKEIVVTGDFNRPKQTYEEWVAGLSPEDELVRQALEHRADQDMLADVYRRVDPFGTSRRRIRAFVCARTKP